MGFDDGDILEAITYPFKDGENNGSVRRHTVRVEGVAWAWSDDSMVRRAWRD